MVENNTNTALGCLGPFPHKKLSISNFFTVFDFVILIILELEDCKSFPRTGLYFSLQMIEKSSSDFLENP